MGWDRIRYFEGVDGESTLISADKASAQTVYGHTFSLFAARLGFQVRQVIDSDRVTQNKHLQSLANRGAHIIEFPADARKEVLSREAYAAISAQTGAAPELPPEYTSPPLAETAIELRPPVTDEGVRILNAYFVTHCDPRDAGLILDHRREPETVIGGY